MKFTVDHIANKLYVNIYEIKETVKEYLKKIKIDFYFLQFIV